MKTFARSEHKKIGQISLAQNFFVPFDRVRRGRFFLESFVEYSMRVRTGMGPSMGAEFARERRRPNAFSTMLEKMGDTVTRYYRK
jgi:hypothetical protein